MDRNDYESDAVNAAHAALLELMTILGEYRQEIAVIGGWVPYFFASQSERPEDLHPGSLDVDIALNHRNLEEAGYATIAKLLENAGYKQEAEQPFRYQKPVNGHLVYVDLLAGFYQGTGKSRRTQKIQGVHARKARGADLVFEISPINRTESGLLPDGSRDTVTVPVAGVVPFIIMKSFAMMDRDHVKDPFDIWFVLEHFHGGLGAVIQAFMPHIENGLVRQGLFCLRDKFAAIDSRGPMHVGAFDQALTADEKAIRQRDAYEKIHYLLEQLGILEQA